MKDVCEPFRDKNITLLGLGLLGRGAGDAEFLAGCGSNLIVTDKKDERELVESVERIKKYPNVKLHLGGHCIEDFTNVDMVIKAAGVPLDSPEIVAARDAKVPVLMSTALFAKYAKEIGAKIVGITGTRGKSTVAHMIFRTLIRKGRPAHLGGNIRGKSTLAMLSTIKDGDLVVLELDSWQLQGFGDLHISPDVAIVTNLMADHQNYYPDIETYFNDKANIFRYQKKGDILIVGTSIAQRVANASPPIAIATPFPISNDWELRVVGEHNRENAALAAAALMSLGLTESEVREGIESFEGVEGRLQFLREINGVKIYNDNNSTTPDATIAAIRALSDRAEKNIILIVGGADKGLNVDDLLSEILQRCKTVVLLAGTGTDRIHHDLERNRNGKIMIYHNLPDAVHAALNVGGAGDTILFSPAFASFGMFKNEYDRNDQFLKLVAELR